MQTVTIVGPGKVGGALAIALDRTKVRLETIIYRSGRSVRELRRRLSREIKFESVDKVSNIRSKTVIIATGDDELAQAAAGLKNAILKETVVIHTSGSLDSRVLAPLRDKGCPTGSMHPLVAVSEAASGADKFSGSYFCIEGTRKAVSSAQLLVRELEGKSFSIPSEHKALYHAAAVMAAGNLVSVFGLAVEMMEKCGLSRKEASRILLPLSLSALGNVDGQSVERALTGPFARLDVETFFRNLNALHKNKLHTIEKLFLMLGEQSLELVDRLGVDERRMREFRKAISVAKEMVR